MAPPPKKSIVILWCACLDDCDPLNWFYKRYLLRYPIWHRLGHNSTRTQFTIVGDSSHKNTLPRKHYSSSAAATSWDTEKSSTWQTNGKLSSFFEFYYSLYLLLTILLSLPNLALVTCLIRTCMNHALHSIQSHFTGSLIIFSSIPWTRVDPQSHCDWFDDEECPLGEDCYPLSGGGVEGVSPVRLVSTGLAITEEHWTKSAVRGVVLCILTKINEIRFIKLKLPSFLQGSTLERTHSTGLLGCVCAHTG